MVHTEESIQIPRDFEGFGEEGHDCKWPNGARIAVSFILNYEEGGERSWQDGDGLSEPYLWEKGSSTGSDKPGGRNLNSEHDFEYGSRAGCWRIFRLMKEFGWNMTLWAIAQAMERNPEFAKACVREGHEIGAHGLRWLNFWDYTIEQDKKYIKDTWEALHAATGEMPVGFYFGRGTPNTHVLVPGVLASMNHKLLYSSECYNDDVPYWVDLPTEAHLAESEREGMLCVPYNYDCNDGKFHMAPGFGSSAGQDYESYLKSTFNMLYREGGKMMNIPMHSRIVGKAGRAEALRRFMLYVQSKEGVWVTTRREIAKHYKETFPYKFGSRTGGK
ncbi:carbohydrate esterase family 4 protein [Pleomassaria siparia CBS 279.74]|uniref:Carbohydrate esterase family 4 protein n=1 Tax=Pleomassaria siparia CBS 279.74 TaxID=1314801 RepID=A0A6G1K5E2_9PLEO|nr:carbohydrate esterase family 4 protein [Pleomassaria siparia CBS 279.74]